MASLPLYHPAAALLLLLAGVSQAAAVPPPCPNSTWVESPAGDCFLQLHLATPVTADDALQLCSQIAPGSYLPETLDPETNLIVSQPLVRHTHALRIDASN